MAFRGRGRGGRGRGRGAAFDQRFAKSEPYILFPEDVNLPVVPNVDNVSPSDKDDLIYIWKRKLEIFWKGSCYHLVAAPKSKSRDTEIERYADKVKQKMQAKREALAFYLKLTSSNFPAELIQGSKRVQHDQKKLRWDRGSDEKLLDLFEKLEEKDKGQDVKGGKEKKGDSEDEEEDVPEEADEESSDDGDYNQNVDFDDDEDDLNMEEEAEEDAYD